jgi:hypothetical protein
MKAGAKVFLDFGVEGRLCFCASVGGDEEYLKERGTSILKKKTQSQGDRC